MNTHWDMVTSVQKKAKRRLQQANARAAEQAVELRLAHMGLAMIEKVSVEVRVVRGKAIYRKAVSGDFRAIVPGGQSVLVEVKRRDEPRLACSDLEMHQHGALTDHLDYGGLSLVAWYHQHQLSIADWSCIRHQLKPRQSIPWLDFQQVAFSDSYRFITPKDIDHG